MAIALHFVAHTRGGWRNVAQPEPARWLWDRLRAWSPEALASTLMLDHLHLLRAGGRRDELVALLSGYARRFGVTWDVPDPTPCHSTQIAVRTAGYILHNAPRAGLVTDPLEWPCSTARDLVGAVYDPWTPLRCVAAAVNVSPAVLEARLLPDGVAVPAGLLVPSLDAIVAATCSALRCTPRALHRRTAPARAVFVDLAYRHGHPPADELARVCDVTPRAIRGLRGRAPGDALAAADRCLGDPRLLRWCAPRRRIPNFNNEN